LLVAPPFTDACADEHADTMKIFGNAGESAKFFGNALAARPGVRRARAVPKIHATTAATCHKGMAIFTVAKGGLMYEAGVSGQKSSYKTKK
jgi:hypothetical protein